MHRLIVLIVLSILGDAAAPAVGQSRADRPDRERILEEVRRTDRTREESARRWAMEHRIPRRIVQRSGEVIELVAVVDGHPTYLAPVNEAAAAITHTDFLYPGAVLGLNLTGAGMEMGIWDGGHVYGQHPELEGRVDFGDEADVSDHATHVAGTLAAAGLDVRARGMAYEAALKSYSWTSDATEMANEGASGMLVSNHSYSILAGWHYGNVEGTGDRWYWVGDPSVSPDEDYSFGWYDTPAVQFDRVAYTNPYLLPVVAAGNDRLDFGPPFGSYRALNAQGDYQTYQISERPIERDGGDNGFDTIAGGGVAKNVLTVGSVGQSTDGIQTSIFSSFGPTDEGRVKPDLMGLGEGLFSLSSRTRDQYARSSGTSMATPNVTGSVLLLQQHYRDVYGAFMRAATLKGLVLHTAADQEMRGPDYLTGWGVLDAEAAAEQITRSIANPAALSEAELDVGETYARDVLVETAGPLRVTLSWTDPPSVRRARSGASSLDDRTRHLVNDLDVRIVHASSGRIYQPYVLDPLAPDQAARPGDNVVDPIEQVFVPGADTGRYVVTVTHKGDLWNGSSQPFSLIVSGGIDTSIPVAVAHLQTQATLDGITLTWATLFERVPGTFRIERAPYLQGAAVAAGNDDYVEVGELSVLASGGREYSFTDDHSLAGRYRYRIVHDDGARRFVAATTDVNLRPPTAYAVLSSYPNPFHERATLVLDLPKTQHVVLEIYDAMGRRLAAVHDGELGAGRHRLPIHGGNWAAGLYFVRVTTPNGVIAHRLIRQ